MSVSLKHNDDYNRNDDDDDDLHCNDRHLCIFYFRIILLL